MLSPSARVSDRLVRSLRLLPLFSPRPFGLVGLKRFLRLPFAVIPALRLPQSGGSLPRQTQFLSMSRWLPGL